MVHNKVHNNACGLNYQAVFFRRINQMETVRMNITLPSSLAKELKQITLPRKRSRFVSDAIAFKIKYLKEQQLEKLLVAGYQATKEEGLKLTKEFEQLDIEGWDEY
jgi:metal-responsive CopG/Arc/MetJ family transcriptional regulator